MGLHRYADPVNRKSIVREWSITEADDRQSNRRTSRSSKSAYSTRSHSDDGSDRRKPFYEIGN